jgi:PPK2 family polyphosphate:nucleotide phosphotransferase
MTATEERSGAAGGDRRRRVIRELQVSPGTPAGLAERDTAWTGGAEFAALSADELGSTARDLLTRGVRELRRAQERLWAGNARALLIVFQAIDAAGKDSTIKHVMSGVNPQGVQVVSFRRPSAEELAHDFLWRISKALPEHGRIGIFNRSHYEEVIGVRVHPEWLAGQRLPAGPRDAEFWAARYEDINAFERHLDRTGTAVLKLFLNVSRAEQKRRFLARLDEPGKEWKFNAADVDERARWPEYQRAYEDALTATSTPWAPWFVVPADSKPVMQAMVAALIVERIRSMDLSRPEVPEAARAANAEARARLLAEPDDEPGHVGDLPARA